MNKSLLHLMHIVSPALPVGAYAYSQGLEFAIDEQWLTSNEALCDWISELLHNGLGHLDLPILLRCMRAWKQQNAQELDRWNDFLRASRETSELLLEDEQLGIALSRLLVDLDIPGAKQGFSAKPSYVTQFALACTHWQIPEPEAMQGFAWSWLENQIAAATKLVPLGQTQAQKLLIKLMVEIEPVCEKSMTLPDDALGLSLPGLAIASAQHERQYSRLFRS